MPYALRYPSSQGPGQARISQAELARRIGISKTAMNAIEGGATDPRASRIVAIAQVLGVSTDTLSYSAQQPQASASTSRRHCAHGPAQPRRWARRRSRG